jgi:hypothetical protein
MASFLLIYRVIYNKRKEAMAQEGTGICCAKCGKSLDALDFKIKSLFFTDKWVCEDCAIVEDESWLKDPSQQLSADYK